MKRLSLAVLSSLFWLWASPAAAQILPSSTRGGPLPSVAANPALPNPQQQVTDHSVNFDRLSPEIRALLQKPDRPTMEESQQDVRTMPETRGAPQAVQSPKGHILDPATWTNVLLKNGPLLIATMEKTFPGATWAFLGRDTQAIADMVEAFYLSIGQRGRVVRIMVSKPSFQGVDEKTLVDFLVQHGFAFKGLKNAPPFVFVDTVSGGNGRQARMLLNSLYNYYATHHRGDPADLVKKLNIFGLIVSTYQGEPTPPSAIEHLTREMELEFSLLDKSNIDYGNEFKFVGYTEKRNKSNEAGYEHFSGAWTGPFGVIGWNGDQLRAQPGPPSDAETRFNILWMQKKIWNTVDTPNFREQVQAAAHSLNYSFPMERPVPEPMVPGGVRKKLPSLIDEELNKNDELASRGQIVPNHYIDEWAESLHLPPGIMSLEGDEIQSSLSNYGQISTVWGSILTSHDLASVSAALPMYIRYLTRVYARRVVTKQDVAFALGQVFATIQFKITSKFIEQFARLHEMIPDIEERIKQQHPQVPASLFLKIEAYRKHKLRGKRCSEIYDVS